MGLKPLKKKLKGVQKGSYAIWKHTITKQNKLVLSSWIPSLNCEKSIPAVHTLLGLRYFVLAAQQTNAENFTKAAQRIGERGGKEHLLQACYAVLYRNNHFLLVTILWGGRYQKWGGSQTKGPSSEGSYWTAAGVAWEAIFWLLCNKFKSSAVAVNCWL